MKDGVLLWSSFTMELFRLVGKTPDTKDSLIKLVKGLTPLLILEFHQFELIVYSLYVQ